MPVVDTLIIHDTTRITEVEIVEKVKLDTVIIEKQVIVQPNNRLVEDIVESKEQGSLVGTINGHDYVDLGLPSGLKWATMNVGAKKPSDSGYYISWGETSPKKRYKWDDYKFRISGRDIDDIKLSKYNTGKSSFFEKSDYGTPDNKMSLELVDDAARKNWKGTWRMPTKDDYAELIKYCSFVPSVLNGRKGMKVVGTNQQSIFFPYAGYWSGGLDGVNSRGEYWTSSLDEEETYCSYMFYISDTKHSVGNGYRRLHGRSIRPVSD